jgi:hypothetical protein
MAQAGRVARALDLAGITNTVGVVYAKIVKGGSAADELLW